METDSSKIFFLKFFVASIFLLMIAVAYAFIADSSNRNVVSEDKISLDIAVPGFVESGEEIVSKVSVSNKNNSYLRSIKIEVVYEESVSSSGEIYNNKIILDVGDVAPLSVVNKDITFKFIGKQEDVRKISAKLSYLVDGAGATFVKDFKSQIKINSDKFLVNIYGRSESIVNLNNTYKLDIKNISNEDYTNVFLKVELPKDFNLVSSSSEKISKIYEIPLIKTGESKEFDFKGYFTNIKNEKRNFRAYLYTKDTTERVLSSSQLEINIIDFPIEVILTADVEDQRVQTLSLGKSAKLDFIVTNINDYSLDDLTILVSVGQNKAIYSFDENQKLKRLAPKDTISFSYPIKNVDASTTPVTINIFGKTKGDFDEIELIKQSYILKAE
jgi:hypothetical protein